MGHKFRKNVLPQATALDEVKNLFISPDERIKNSLVVKLVNNQYVKKLSLLVNKFVVKLYFLNYLIKIYNVDRIFGTTNLLHIVLRSII